MRPAAGVSSAGPLTVGSLRAATSERLLSALEAHAVAVVQMAPGHWAFGPAAAPALRATARLTDDWLLFDAPLPEPAAGSSAWDVFAVNAQLSGGLKWCAAAPDSTLRLRAEVPLAEQQPLAGAVQEVCAGLVAAVAGRRPGTPGASPATSAATPGTDGVASGLDLQALCAAAAWPFTARGADTVMVELDVPGFQQAAVERHPDRGVVVSVPVLSEAPATPVCAAAVGAFLLRVTDVVRLVRAATRTANIPVCFEVVHAAVPSPAELAEAFAALSLAWRWAGREATMLATDERVAHLYLDRAPPHIGRAGVWSTTTNNEQPAP
jgi:hypothetical protein